MNGSCQHSTPWIGIRINLADFNLFAHIQWLTYKYLAMKFSYRCRGFAPQLLPLIAVALIGVQLLGAHIHLHGGHHDHSAGHVHSVHSPCHADADHLGECAEISLWQALLCKLPDVPNAGAALAPLLILATTANGLNVATALDHLPARWRMPAHFIPPLRAPPR